MIFWWIVRIALWALAGYVAARLMNTSLSLIWNIVLGLVGGAVGSLAAGLIGIGSTNMLGGTLMFLFWRRVLKQFFWKFASRSQKLEKAEQWVSRFDVSSLFMLSVLPFTPSSFMHFAFGISDFDEKRYLITMLLGKGVMVAMMALFGQSLVSSMKNPVYLVLAVVIWGAMYWGSKRFCKKHDL